MLGRLRFGLIDLIRGTNSVALLRELEALQFEAPGTLAQRQHAMLAEYSERVRAAVPLYARYKHFADFPVIDKAFANAHRDQLLNPDYRGKLIRKKTGGSTGEPFVYFTGTRAQSYLWAAILLSWRVSGYRLGEPVAFLAGTSLFGTGYKQKIYYKLMNVQVFSAFDMSPEKLTRYAEGIAAGGCRLLYGYASAIHQLALHIQRTGIKPAFRLRGVVCTAEVLTPAMRVTIEAAFGVPCYSQYGCNDAGVSAFECEERHGFHLISQRAYTEVQDDGRLVSTDLSNDAFFLPRYDTGDLVTMADAPCKCGRGFPLIAKVVGRANDMVEDAHGNAVHSEFFTHLFREDRRISEFQVVYDRRELVVIVHCADPAFDHPPYLERIRAGLKFDVVRFAINRPFVATRNAKHRFVMRLDNVEQAMAERIAS
ncbi:MAG: phenylacetate--CoA ligase family protein [Gammaproteobacteria bacterium]